MAEPAGADPATIAGAALDSLVPEGGVAVAVSGGGDSMALLLIAHGWAQRSGRALRAVTIDHRLRPESAGEAAFVEEACAPLGVPHSVLTVGHLPPGNLPAAAREARYTLIADWARSSRIASVLLGHTLDDQAETLLMRLARGSGVEGLSAMAPRRDWRGIAWVRPLLDVRRAALRDWLRGLGVGWIEDPTNEDSAYDRVKARRALALLAPLGITAEGLAETARRLARQRRVLERAAAETAAASVRPGAFGEARLHLPPLRRVERDTALRVVADALVRIAGRAYRPRFRALEPAVSALLEDGGTGTTLGGCLLVPEPEDAVLICREPAAVAGPLPLAAPTTLWDGRWRIGVPDNLPAGLTVGALGREGCDILSRAVRDRLWQPPQGWSAAARPVRETVPAIFAPAAAGQPAPVAVPSAGFLSPEAPAAAAAITAALVACDFAA